MQSNSARTIRRLSWYQSISSKGWEVRPRALPLFEILDYHSVPHPIMHPVIVGPHQIGKSTILKEAQHMLNAKGVTCIEWYPQLGSPLSTLIHTTLDRYQPSLPTLLSWCDDCHHFPYAYKQFFGVDQVGQDHIVLYSQEHGQSPLQTMVDIYTKYRPTLDLVRFYLRGLHHYQVSSFIHSVDQVEDKEPAFHDGLIYWMTEGAEKERRPKVVMETWKHRYIHKLYLQYETMHLRMIEVDGWSQAECKRYFTPSPLSKVQYDSISRYMGNRPIDCKRFLYYCRHHAEAMEGDITSIAQSYTMKEYYKLKRLLDSVLLLYGQSDGEVELCDLIENMLPINMRARCEGELGAEVIDRPLVQLLLEYGVLYQNYQHQDLFPSSTLTATLLEHYLYDRKPTHHYYDRLRMKVWKGFPDMKHLAVNALPIPMIPPYVSAIEEVDWPERW